MGCFLPDFLQRIGEAADNMRWLPDVARLLARHEERTRMKRTGRYFGWTRVVVAAMAGTMLATACAPEQVARISAGIQAALEYEPESNSDRFEDLVTDWIDGL